MGWSSGIFLFVACWWCLHLFGFAECEIIPCLTDPGNGNKTCVCSFELEATVARCEGKNLTKIPSGLPANLTHLFLDNNAITNISKPDIAGFQELLTLSLEGNKIDRIERGAFESSHKLNVLNLAGNLLNTVSSDWFQHLPSIRAINMSHNRIRSIERKAFLTLPASQHPVTVDLGGNDIFCSCPIKAIKRWNENIPKKLSRVTFENFQCTNRKNVKKNLQDLTDSDFPNCSNSEIFMSQAKDRCSTCSNASTHFACDLSWSTCGERETMCFSYVTYTDQSFHIEKGCRNVASCLQAERETYGYCHPQDSQDGNQIRCFFCCAGDLCNQGDMGGRTKSLLSFLALSLNAPFERYMMETFNVKRREQQAYWTKQMATVLKTVPGFTTLTTDVEFLSFRNESSKVRVAFLLRLTTISGVNSSAVFRAVFQTVRASAENGTLKNLDLDRVDVGTELAFSGKCQAELYTVMGRELLWSETDHGNSASLPCGPSGHISPGQSIATRQCVLGADGVARWEKVNIYNCHFPTADLEELTKVPISPETVPLVLKGLDSVARDRENMTSQEMAVIMDTLNRTLAETSSLVDGSSVQAAVNVLSSLLDVDETNLQASQQEARVPERILQAVELISTNASLTNGTLKIASPHLIILAQLAEPATFRGLALVAERDPDNQLRNDKVMLTEGGPPESNAASSIQLPANLLASASTASRISMSVFSSASLFEAVKTGQDKQHQAVSNDTSAARINSIVIAASVVGMAIQDLKDPLLLTFSHINNASGNPRCVFWKADNDSGDWSTQGCRVVDSSDNGTTCACDHMTNFALLMDVYSSGQHLSEADKKALSIISYVGCGISLLALTLTLLTYLLFRKLRRDNPSRILINLCSALLLSNLVFVVGMHEYTFDNIVACKAVAAMLHFALLSGVCWMAVEAFYMYLALVRVFKTYFTCFLLKCSLVGWGIPLVIVMLTLVVNKTDNYAALDTGICWLHGVAFYASFVAPVCLVMLVNFTAFALVVWQLTGVAERSLTKSDSFSTAQRLRGAVGVVILLGLTWIFAVFAIDTASVPFYYLFAIFNSLQGLFIFVFYCVLKKDARKAWQRRLPCIPEEEESITSRAIPATTGTHGSKSYTSSTYVNSTSFAKDSYHEPNPAGRLRSMSNSSQSDDNVDKPLNRKDKTVIRHHLDRSSNAVPSARGANSGSMTGEGNHIVRTKLSLQDPVASDSPPPTGDERRQSKSLAARASHSSSEEVCGSQGPAARAACDAVGSDVTPEMESSRL